MDDTGLAPRRAALALLDRVTGEGRLLSEPGGVLDRLPPEDRARAQRLATETLRGLERADRMLKPFLRKRPPLTVRNALRLGTVEIGQGGAGHGVVNAWVEIVARGQHTGKLKGLVNAVLRQVAEQGPPVWEKLPVSVMPRWLRRPLAEAWGDRAVQRMEHAHFAGAPLDLTAKGDPAALAGLLGGELLPTGSVRLRDAGQVTALPGWEAGEWWVQDAAAALPARLLAPTAGERVLDLCAAPGGKTLQLAAAGARVTAVDVSETRMERVRENLARTGLEADCRVGDAFELSEGGFDAILLDAPCSATGTIRRHPDLPHGRDGSEFGALIEQQEGLLDHALTLLAPGGRLVYCTCSLLPDEGEVQAEEAIARHEGLRADREALALPGVDPAWITEEGGLRTRPDYWSERGGMDGFYMAVLRR